MVLGKLANFSVLQFFHLEVSIRIPSATLPASEGLTEVMVKLKFWPQGDSQSRGALLSSGLHQAFSVCEQVRCQGAQLDVRFLRAL